MILGKYFKKIIILSIFFLLIFGAFRVVLAQNVDLGMDYGEAVGLEEQDPRIAIASIIRILLGFLGLVAVSILIYAGWLYMTSDGNADQVDRAKKIIIGAIIGLVIILSAIAVVSFVISKMTDITSGDGPGGGSGDVIPGGGASFMISSTIPEDGKTNVIRNTSLRVFFNQAISSSTVDQATLIDNFLVEKIAEIDPITGTTTLISVPPLWGAVNISDNRKEIYFLVESSCGNIDHCYDAWSQYRVTVNSLSEIVNESGQGLDCAGDTCQFEFSTSDSVDNQRPNAGIEPVQICYDDGTISNEANYIGGWGSDDYGIASITFFENDVELSKIIGAGQDYLYAEYRVTGHSESDIGKKFTYEIVAEDLSGEDFSDDFKTTLKPGHCCNGILDEDFGEEGIDCGGDCLACLGGKCNTSEPNECGENDINCDDDLCISWFCDCKEEGCMCESKPIIDWISPVGGFCEGSPNTFCQNDGDCLSFDPSVCNMSTSNARVGNLITIGGRYFGEEEGQVFFDDGNGGFRQASLATDANPNCDKAWSKNQVIVRVPDGAASGPIRIESATGYSDTTDDNSGPFIDFIINDISRPGICGINPDSAPIGESITYYGLNLESAIAYFGNSTNNFIGNNSNFSAQTGSAEVPNIQQGKTSTFVIQDQKMSNYLNFYKENDPYTGPFIISFEPQTGKAGQYVTIYGSGFGHIKGTSKVYFDYNNGIEANYDFPEVCADSVWSDNQIIVKVPEDIADGDYVLSIDTGAYLIDSFDLEPGQFSVDAGQILSPSLCRISPNIGPNNSSISLWGEYFGSKDSGAVRFFDLNDQTGDEILFWGDEEDAQKIETTIHQAAATGPVKVVQNEIVGNGINFQVGLCESDAACGVGMVCCGADSIEAGSCKINSEECYVAVESCVYEFDFSTGVDQIGDEEIGESCDADGDSDNGVCVADAELCADGLVCSESDCTCQMPCDNDLDINNGCSANNTCAENLGLGWECDLDTCLCFNPVESCSGKSRDTGECASGPCPNSPGECSSYIGGNEQVVGECDSGCDGVGLCTAGMCTYVEDLNKCILGGAFCDFEIVVQDILGNSLSAYCASYGGNNHWHIDTNLSCPPGWIMTSGGKCVDTSTTCDLCPDEYECIDNNNVGVCAAQASVCPDDSTCVNNECISIDKSSCECCCDKNNASQDCCAPLECTGECGSGGDYGNCTGCSEAGSTQAEHDAACNCLGSIGKYCDSEAAGGRGECRDCASMSSPEECSEHASCCVDAQADNICRAGTGNTDIVNSDSIAYCEYYQCTEDGEACDTGNLVASSSTTLFTNLNACNAECGIVEEPVLGASCDNGNQVIDTCNEGVCAAPFSCITEDGSAASPPSQTGSPDSCGFCCCDPSIPDQCASAGLAGLNCQANNSPCTGENRGLCCGCSSDTDCVSTANAELVGCSSDTCCRARPNITSVFPEDQAVDICRNSEIMAVFDTEMDINTFSSNMILLGEYRGACPNNSVYLTQGEDRAKVRNIFAKIKQRFTRLISYFSKKQVIADSPSAAFNYCALSGTVGGEQLPDGTTRIRFTAHNSLAADQKYFVVVKGDEALDSKSGVKNSFAIGMNGPGDDAVNEIMDEVVFNGISFKNAKIWSFSTMDEGAPFEGNCQIDYVEVQPSSYLFQTTDDDLSEDDTNPVSVSFDTVGDRDKVFIALAKSADGQVLASSPSYSWTWSWTIDNTGVVNFSGDAGFGADSDKQLLEAQEGISDDKTSITATANINSGGEVSGQANAWVFLCSNPWPAPVNGIWNPWQDEQDNCTIEAGGCDNSFNYQFYYCRDSGADGTADDLPAILSDNTITRGYSSEQNILKESYFFRESLPDMSSGVSEFLTVNSVPEEGSKVILSWADARVCSGGIADGENCSVSDVDCTTGGGVCVQDLGIAGYKLYYGQVSGKYTDYLDAGDVNQKEIDELENGEKYYFVVTSYYSNNAESAYSNEVSATPIDVRGPGAPIIHSLVPGDSKITINWADSSGGDALGFRVFYRASEVCDDQLNFASSQALNLNPAILTGLNNGTRYCVGLVAYDEYGNSSATSTNSAIPNIE